VDPARTPIPTPLAEIWLRSKEKKNDPGMEEMKPKKKSVGVKTRWRRRLVKGRVLVFWGSMWEWGLRDLLLCSYALRE
jgi:hypothetical protein